MMEKNKKDIPLYHLNERENRNFRLYHSVQLEDITHWEQAHRDDNYLFFFQRSGMTRLMIDFKEIIINGCAIYCILPGQVHYAIETSEFSACVLAVDPASVKENYRYVFDAFAFQKLPVSVAAEQVELLQMSLNLLGRLVENDCEHQLFHTLDHMLNVSIGLFAETCRSGHQGAHEQETRQQVLTRQFRKLLLQNFREMKSPRKYAAALHVSPSYLNEVVKNATGFPVSSWIHQEIILEAKRQLFYTNITVKELSHLLGYTDTPYFIRLFGKTTGMSPLEFRGKYRK